MDEHFVQRMPALCAGIKERFLDATVAGAWERRVVTSLLRTGGRPAIISIALIPCGDWIDGTPVAEIRADTGTGSIKSFAQVAAAHLAGLKGRVDIEQASYDALRSDIETFLKAQGVVIDRAP